MMTPQKRQSLMFAVLIASVLFGLYMKPWVRRDPKAISVTPETGPVEAVEASVEPALTAIEYVGEWPKRDPFRRSDEYVAVSDNQIDEAVSYGEPTFSLQGIMTIDGQKACVIDGRTCVVGGKCSGWRLEEIEAQGVWVSQGGERRFVPLP
jgi:hypothetical protein